MPNYDFIHLPPWRARARRAGVRSNPGNDHQRARSQMPDRPPFQSQTRIRTARFAAPRPSKTHAAIWPIEIP
jgi:hypothetical protein